MKCAFCGNEFSAPSTRTKYCSVRCRNKRNYIAHKKRLAEPINFLAEWQAWKRDFARGKIKSHLLEVTL